MFNLDFLRRFSLMGTTKCMQHPAMSCHSACDNVFCYILYTRLEIQFYVMLCYVSKAMPFSINYHACIAMPTWRRCAPPYFVLTLTSIWPLPEVVFNLDLFRRSSLMGTTLRAATSRSYALSTNYHAWIALPTWRAPHILFWPWPPDNLLPRSCLTWIFFGDSHWWVQRCVQRPAKVLTGGYHFACSTQQKLHYAFQQIIMHALHNQHDVDVHLLFCFDHDLNLTCSQDHVSSNLIDRYDFVCITHQKLCHNNTWSFMYCNAHTIYMYTFFVLTSIHLICSCFIHVQHLELRARGIPVTTGACLIICFN